MIKETGLRYAFCTRVQYYEDSVLTAVNDEIGLEQTFLDFYRDYELCMQRGKNDSNTPNLHSFSHSLDQRKGECWKYSAEPFESAYFVIKKLFAKGTNNRTKQLLSKYLIRDLIRHHCHLNQKLIVKVKKTVSQDNSVVTMEQNGKLVFLRVSEIDHEHCVCSPIKVSPFKVEEDLHLSLPWHLIGVYQYNGESDEKIQVPLKDIKGKGVIAAGTICELRPEWLQSRLQQ